MAAPKKPASARQRSGGTPIISINEGLDQTPQEAPPAAADERPLRAVPDLPAGAATGAAEGTPPGASAGGGGPALLSGGMGTATGLLEALRSGGAEQMVGVLVDSLRFGGRVAGIDPAAIEERIADVLAYLRRRVAGQFEVDDYGFDADFAEHVWFPLLRPIYHSWFRVEVTGIENLPSDTGALVVANHSGTVPVDGLMLQLAVHDETGENRVLRALGADLVFQLPFVGSTARRAGTTLATNADAERLLTQGHLVAVFPEGFKGVGKPFSERYKLQRFGRGGFVTAALRTGAPIVPVSIVGAEEIYPLIGNLSALARMFGAPYFPVTPFFPLLGPLGLVPLPSKWLIEIGEPIDTAALGPEAAEDPMLVFDLADQVRETIQQSLHRLLLQRRSVFR